MANWPRSICVFCGASRGVPSHHVALARHLGRLLAEAGVTVIYGGAMRGLMGELADAPWRPVASLSASSRTFW